MANKTILGLPTRIIFFILGIIIASIILVYSFQWDLLPFTVVWFGFDVTPYALASFIVLLGILASTLIKSGITGKKKIDA